jgi:hypothetical protein
LSTLNNSFFNLLRPYEFQQKYNFSGGYSDFDFGNCSGSYYESSSSNYNFGGYRSSKVSSYIEEDKQRLKKLYKALVNKDFEVFYNRQIPINDGGISFGQLYAASAIIEGEGN